VLAVCQRHRRLGDTDMVRLDLPRFSGEEHRAQRRCSKTLDRNSKAKTSVGRRASDGGSLPRASHGSFAMSARKACVHVMAR
jgi:hypothetical protein